VTTNRFDLQITALIENVKSYAVPFVASKDLSSERYMCELCPVRLSNKLGVYSVKPERKIPVRIFTRIRMIFLVTTIEKQNTVRVVK
jgi:hypothetical protein